MSKRSYAHGTPEQMLAAFESKLQELGGDISACSTVSAASFVDIDGQFGEPGATITEQEIREYWDNEHLNDPSLSYYGEDGFDEWYRDTKQWLTPVKGAESYAQVETNAEATSRFIHTLVGDVNAALEANSELDSWTWEEQEKDLVLTTIAGDSINEYAIPKADLTMDWDRISEDVDYILNEVQNVEDDEVFEGEEYTDVVESSEIIEGSEYKSRDYRSPPEDFDPSSLTPSKNYMDPAEECVWVDSSADVESDSQYEKIRSKMVADSDGFMTDYTMYYDIVNDRYVFVFGDNEVYRPEDEDFDWECETEEQANEWFDSYEGFAEDEDADAILESTEVLTQDADDLLEAGWFDNASRDVIRAGWTEDGEIIVSLNHGVKDIEAMAAELTSYIEDNNYHVIDWNVNGSAVFIFEVIHSDDYEALSESTEYFTPEEDPEDEFGEW